MQRKTFSTLKKSAGVLGCAALLAGNARGAELGELSVHSFIGQPLVADIELTALAPDEVTGLQVRLASLDVYRGANIGMNPALESLHLSLMRHDDQRQFLHLSSLRAVEANHLLLFLTLSAGGRSAVRSATLWLSPDPRPAMLSVLPPAAPPVAPRVTPPVAPQVAPTATPSTAPSAALPAAPLEINRGQNGGQARSPAATLPAHPPGLASRHRSESLTMPERFRAQSVPGTSRACAPQASEQVLACAELDIRNAVLGPKIVELEEKVKVLQVAFEPRPELAPAPIEAGVANGAPGKALHPVQTVAASSGLLAWSASAAALLMTGIGGYLFLRRKNGKMPFKPSKYWVLLRSPFGRKARAAPSSPSE